MHPPVGIYRETSSDVARHWPFAARRHGAAREEEQGEGVAVPFQVVPWRSPPCSAMVTATSRMARSTYCGVDLAQTTSSTSARVRFTSASSLCGSSGANWIAFACRTSGSSHSSQGWTVAFSSYKSFGVGSSARFDVQTIATNEMGHVMYVDHNPSWTNGITQGNSCAGARQAAW